MPDLLAAAVSPTGDVLAISIEGQAAVYVHAMWVRDACGCSECRRPLTNERLLDSTTIDPSITIVDSVLTADALSVELSDGHTSVLGIDWVTAHASALEPSHPADDVRLWTAGCDEELAHFERDHLDRPPGLCAWLDEILEHGAAVLHDVPPDEDGLRAVAALVAEIRATNYGVTWEIAASVEPVSAVESERHLLVHTDLPYRSESPGVQLLLASVADVEGGASTLVDGFAAAEQLRAADLEAWELLTRIDFTYPYVRDDVEIHGRAPLIGLGTNWRYAQIRRAPDLVGVPLVAADSAPALSRAVRLWNDLLDDPASELSIRLGPSDLLAFDNHRMLHGRTAFELGASGQRRLLGCYLDRDDLLSRRAIVARSL